MSERGVILNGDTFIRGQNIVWNGVRWEGWKRLRKVETELHGSEREFHSWIKNPNPIIMNCNLTGISGGALPWKEERI
jgi:hypothetical protein